MSRAADARKRIANLEFEVDSLRAQLIESEERLLERRAFVTDEIHRRRLSTLLRLIVHSPRVPPADWPDADLVAIRLLAEDALEPSEVDIFKGWWRERRSADAKAFGLLTSPEGGSR